MHLAITCHFLLYVLLVHIDVESNLSCHRLNINLLNSSINIVYLFFGNYLFKSVRVNNLPIENIIFYHILIIHIVRACEKRLSIFENEKEYIQRD